MQYCAEGMINVIGWNAPGRSLITYLTSAVIVWEAWSRSDEDVTT